MAAVQLPNINDVEFEASLAELRDLAKTLDTPNAAPAGAASDPKVDAAREAYHTWVERLDSTAGHFAAERYVGAAGAWSKALLGRQGAQLDIKPVRGQMLLYRAQPGTLRQIVLQNGVYLIPRADGHILVGSTLEEVGFDKETTGEAGAALHARALAMLPELAQAEFVRHWAGLRPGSPGNIPVIARHPQLENLYLNSGHFRYGVTMAPVSAQVLANHLFGREQPFNVSSYAWPS